jgi:hypothetical protein
MLGVTLLLGLLAAAPTDDAPCEARDERGRPFQTCFDPGAGLALGVDVTQPGAVTLSPTLGLSGGILLRSERESRSRQGSYWFNEHRLLATRAWPGQGFQRLLLTAYGGTYRRHLAEGFVLIPTSRPTRLPFPFDVAIGLDAGRYERRVYEGRGYTLETVRAAFLLDPLRSDQARARLSFGPALSHQLRSDGVSLQHELSPFTSAQAELGLESEDGWWVVRLTGLAGWVFVPGQPEGLFRARGEATVERLILAIEDQPLYLAVNGTGSLHDAGVQRRSEWTASVGLVLRAFGR